MAYIKPGMRAGEGRFSGYRYRLEEYQEFLFFHLI
jgi:hypothetical protein